MKKKKKGFKETAFPNLVGIQRNREKMDRRAESPHVLFFSRESEPVQFSVKSLYNTSPTEERCPAVHCAQTNGAVIFFLKMYTGQSKLPGQVQSQCGRAKMLQGKAFDARLVKNWDQFCSQP